MKRKVSLAIALAGQPSLIVLDEPTSSMDAESRHQMREVILQLKQNHCIVLTSQHLDEAEELGDRVGLMHHGQLLCVGSVDFIRKTFGVG